MMPCTIHIKKDGCLYIKIPESAFVNAVENFKKHTNAKVWIPDSNIIEVNNITIKIKVLKDMLYD